MANIYSIIQYLLKKFADFFSFPVTNNDPEIYMISFLDNRCSFIMLSWSIQHEYRSIALGTYAEGKVK